MMFKKAKQNRVFQDVIHQIQEAIVSGDLKAGDRLPSERTLKETFHISRGTLREALRVLEQKGLIEIKTGVGGGAFVKNVDSGQFSETLDLLMRTQRVPLRDLAAFRADVEGIVTGLAASRATPDDFRRLREIVEGLTTLAGSENPSWGLFVDSDNAFHMELARIAGNRIYALILKSIHDHIGRYFDSFLSRDKKVMAATCSDLTAIITAVEQHDAIRAKELAGEHVHRFNIYMEKSSGRSTP